MKRITLFITIIAMLGVIFNFNVINAQEDGEKILIAYFSRMENSVGNESGIDSDAVTSASLITNANTEIMAQYIEERTGGDLFPILVTEPYPVNYEECLTRAQQENSENARPAIQSIPQDIDSYDTIFIGYPDWCGTCPMAVFTFLESIDTDGKKIIPFCAHGTSGLGTSVSDIEKECPGAAVETALGVYRDDIDNCEQDMQEWLSELGYGNSEKSGSVEMTLTENSVVINADKPINNASLILAGYVNGLLTNVNIRTVSTNEELEIIEDVNGFDDADMVKAFLWTDIDGIQPLCTSDGIQPDISASKSLVVYFSRVGNTDYSSDVDATTSASVVTNNNGNITGTTETVAEIISDAVQGDIVEIHTVDKYPTDFDDLVSINHDEINRGFIPEIMPMDIDMSEYDTVFIGYPIWATTIPQAVRSFMREYDLSGKTVIPFCTHDGYGSGSSYSEIASECANSNTLEGLAVAAEDIVGKDLSEVNETVLNWLGELGIETGSEEQTQIKITVGDRVLDGYLNDTPEAEQFKAMMPITVSMVGYGGREYYGGIDSAINAETPGKLNFENGDITYCPTNNTVAIFYAQTDRPDLTMEVISMGKVISDLSVFDELGSSEDIVFSLAE